MFLVLSYDWTLAVAFDTEPVICTPLFSVDDGVRINILWNDVVSSKIASASNLLPWSDIVSFSIAPICEDHAYIFAPVPCDTFSWTNDFAVEEFEPVIVSPAW